MEQKLHIAVAIAVSALLSLIAFAPTGYPHNILVKNILSQLMPNKNLVTECLRLVCNFNVSVVSTIKGNSAGNTLYAQILSPLKKLCIYFAGAVIKMMTTIVNNSVDVKRKYFT